MNPYTRTIGFLLYVGVTLLLLCLLPHHAFNPASDLFLLSIGFLAIWRYSWMGLHYMRAYYYLKVMFPQWRAKTGNGLPSKLYIIATFFRISPPIAARVLHAMLHEAISMDCPVMITLSLVEAQDEEMAMHIISQYSLPDTLKIHIIRAKGSGKRHGLAQALRVVSQDMPEDDSLCVIMDGDTVLLPESVKRCLGFFALRPNLGACTTDELGHVEGSPWLQSWYDLRFAQRHILMSSISCSKRVMTLTGRMSVFRASIVTEAGFIDCIENDYLDHWRLGRVKLLTGDDKSSLYYVMKQGYEQIYIPDVQVVSLEQPPTDSFFRSSAMLMRRWFGNMLRTNGRVLKLGIGRVPFFVWWSFLDQRLSMWTTFCGPLFALMLSFRYGMVFILYYVAWVALMRGLLTISLFMARRHVSWRYPILLYYNQIFGSFLKIWVLFHSYKQSWTRQNISVNSNNGKILVLWNRYSSLLLYAFSVCLLVVIIGFASSIMITPYELSNYIISIFPPSAD